MAKPKHFKNQNYDQSDAMRITDLFPDQFIDEVQLGTAGRNRKYSGEKRKYVHGIFFSFLNILQDHLLETGDKYVLPTIPTAYIYICEKNPRDMSRIRGNKLIYRNANPILSSGKIYQMVFYCSQLRYKKNWVRIDYKRYMKLLDKVNQGQRYYFR